MVRVAARQGEPAGCAFVWRTAYLSGIGVVPDERGRGIDRALTVAASRIAVTDAPDGCGPGLVWMHATEEGART